MVLRLAIKRGCSFLENLICDPLENGEGFELANCRDYSLKYNKWSTQCTSSYLSPFSKGSQVKIPQRTKTNSPFQKLTVRFSFCVVCPAFVATACCHFWSVASISNSLYSRFCPDIAIQKAFYLLFQGVGIFIQYLVLICAPFSVSWCHVQCIIVIFSNSQEIIEKHPLRGISSHRLAYKK